ncbi:uncharacterized protein N7477_001892 [Penicillium maclennaniae]|uniref:uncharacterized protein n=1 Tax=Penicillium maclennaniae TaxID=1343394 RepID=UPI0025423037|nr:uncharacterized protein N7477_001892 [Penicillium maclennaniae]KAJ5681952.1 hypothetical protein N7477_001892 [Penicillium maclennaniae]
MKTRTVSADSSEAYIKETAPEKYWPLLPKFEIGCKSDQEYSADAILLATDFSLTQYDVELTGRDGRTLEDHWNEFGYKEAYKSIAMSGFPNFFYILGPNSGKGHTSTIYSIENHVDLVIKVITPVIKEQSSFVEVKADSERLYDEKLHASIAKTVFNDSCGSYFIDKKSRKNWFIYSWSSFAMWYSTHWDNADDWIYAAQLSTKYRVLRSGRAARILSLGLALLGWIVMLGLKFQLA